MNFPEKNLISVEDATSTYQFLESGLCNVIGEYIFNVDYSAVTANGYTGAEEEYQTGTIQYTKSFETFLTRNDDRVFSKFVSWIWEAIVKAEESGITKATADQMGTTDVFGPQFQNIFRHAVRAVGEYYLVLHCFYRLISYLCPYYAGNYGDIWKDLPFPRSGLNQLNNGTSGLILSMDFGSSSEGFPPDDLGTIKSIQNRGLLRCGVRPREGFALREENFLGWSGLEIDLCNGISAALFDGQVKVEIVDMSFIERFAGLQGGAIDFVFGATRTIDREVKHNASGGAAYDFTPPYFYDGLSFAGVMRYASCADNLTFSNSCVNTKICVRHGTSWLNSMRNHLQIPESNVVVSKSISDGLAKFAAGECNVMAGEQPYITQSTLEQGGFDFSNEEYFLGSKKFTKEPLSIMSRSDDSQFSDFLRWIVWGFFHAEENDIGKENSWEMPERALFGPGMARMWQNAVKESGNYGTMYQANLESLLRRRGQNLLNDKGGPQLYVAFNL